MASGGNKCKNMHCTRIDGQHMQMLSETFRFLAYFRHISVAFETEKKK